MTNEEKLYQELDHDKVGATEIVADAIEELEGIVASQPDLAGTLSGVLDSLENSLDIIESLGGLTVRQAHAISKKYGISFEDMCLAICSTE